MIDIKATAGYLFLGWLLVGAGAGLADSSPPNLVGVWTKAVKIDVRDPKSQDSRTQYDSSDMEFALTSQEGRTVKGTRTANGTPEPITCEIRGDAQIDCRGESGIFQGELYGSDEITGTYRTGGNSVALSVLILRRKK